MLSGERAKIILDYLDEHELVSTVQLCEMTGASVATVRRDLNSLHKQHLLEKTHGGARRLLACSTAFSAYRNRKSNDALFSEKSALAAAAARFIQPGEVVFLGAGESCTLMARYLKETKRLTVVTTNLNLVLELAPQGHSIFLLGGDIHVGGDSMDTQGEYAMEELRGLYFDRVFFTVDGIDLENGYSVADRSRLPLYRYIMKNCRDAYLLADSSGFGRRAFAQFCPIGHIAHVIAGTQIPFAYEKKYADVGVQVHVCGEDAKN